MSRLVQLMMFCWLAIVVCVAGTSACAVAASPSTSKASVLVQSALRSELDGPAAGRKLLLKQALQRDPNFAPARWHTGHLQRSGPWEPFVGDLPRDKVSEKLIEYRKRRASAEKSYQGHLELANWCQRHDLVPQERAHLTAALQLSENPNDPKLRARLGFTLVGGKWLSREEIETAKTNRKQLERSLKHWIPKLERIARGLSSNRVKVRERNSAKLKAIDDPDALPAMEAVFSNLDLKTAHLLLDVYAEMKTHRARVALARQAVYSPWATVRETAAERLQSYPPEEYAPELLAALHTPTQSKLNLFVGGDTVFLTQAFYRENQENKQLVVLNSKTRFRLLRPSRRNLRIPQGRGNSLVVAQRDPSGTVFRQTVNNFLTKAGLKAYERNRRIDVANEETERLNERICEALSRATQLNLPHKPTVWWKWWLDYNDLYEDGDKPVQRLQLDETSVETVEGVVDPKPPRPRSSCLAAGTIVWSDRGPVPVETVRVGDLVLSKQPETGELTYKPVLRTTIRPATPLVKASVGGRSFKATGGHTFWISGHGWMKIRDVKPGMSFHGALHPSNLQKLEKGGKQRVYNLVVADFHTYFVGPSMLLSHDPTFAQPTDMVVPGLLTAHNAR